LALFDQNTLKKGLSKKR